MSDIKAKRNLAPFIAVKFLDKSGYEKYHLDDKAIERNKNIKLGKTIVVKWGKSNHRAKVVYEGSKRTCQKFIDGEISTESAVSDPNDEESEAGLNSSNSTSSSGDDELADPLAVPSSNKEPNLVPPSTSPGSSRQSNSGTEETENCEEAEFFLSLRRDISAGVNLATVARNLFKNLYRENYTKLSFTGKSRSKTPMTFKQREDFFSHLDKAFKMSLRRECFVLTEGMSPETQNEVFKARRHVEVTLSQLASDEASNRKKKTSYLYTYEPEKLLCNTGEEGHQGHVYVCVRCDKPICQGHMYGHDQEEPGYDYINSFN